MNNPKPLIVRTQSNSDAEIPAAVKTKIEELTGKPFAERELRSAALETQHHIHFERRITV